MTSVAPGSFCALPSGQRSARATCRVAFAAALPAIASVVIVLVIVLSAASARGEYPDPTLPAGSPPYRPAALPPRDQRPLSAVLDELEREVFAVATGEADAKNLPRIEREANAAFERATTNNERTRAQYVVRRADRLRWRNEPAPFSPTNAPPTATSSLANPSAAAPNPLPGVASSAFTNNLVTLAQFIAPQPPAPGMGASPYPSGPDATFAAGPPLPMPVYAPLPRHYISLDALGWFVQADKLPALVTTSPAGTPQEIAGVLGLPTTSVLFGNQSVNGGMRPGGRVQGGVWLDPYQSVAIEGHYYALATANTNYFVASTFNQGPANNPILARPFFNDAPMVNAESSVLTAFPGFIVPPPTLPPQIVNLDGSITIRESSNLQSAGAGSRFALNPANSRARLSAWGGYRYFNLNETISILASSNFGTNPFPFPIPPGRVESFDSFATRNVFNGGEIGLAANVNLRRWVVSADTRLAMGGMFQSLDIEGRTSAISNGYIASYPGGLLAMPTNIGHYTRTRFALIPQVDVKLGYQLFPSLRVNVGYNFTYVSSVLRPGNQIDTTVNTTQIAGLPLIGPAHPQATVNASGVWLQGITVGFDLYF